MKIDLTKVDLQIQKLQELKRIASDPEMLALLETVMTTNGTSHRAVPVIPPAASTVRKSSKGVKKGAVLGAVKDAALKMDRPFTGYDLARKMQAEGYVFTATNPGLATTDSLRSLLKKGVVTLYKKGRGSDPAVYMKV